MTKEEALQLKRDTSVMWSIDQPEAGFIFISDGNTEG